MLIYVLSSVLLSCFLFWTLSSDYSFGFCGWNLALIFHRTMLYRSFMPFKDISKRVSCISPIFFVLSFCSSVSKMIFLYFIMRSNMERESDFI